jgi:hypothetical protein
MLVDDVKIRTQEEAFELWIPYLIEFHRSAEIQEIITCGDDDANGNPRVTERRLIATIRRLDMADGEKTQPPSSQLDQDSRIR